jgi:hypothetical protein
VPQLAKLQDYSLFDLAFQNVIKCVSSLEIAAHCVAAEDGGLLTILSTKLNVNTTSSTLHYVNDAINLSNDPTAH